MEKSAYGKQVPKPRRHLFSADTWYAPDVVKPNRQYLKRAHDYYHCRYLCGARCRCETVNERFTEELCKLFPKPGMEKVFVEIIKGPYKQDTAENNGEIVKLSKRVSELQEGINKARTKFMTDQIDQKDYQDYRKQCEEGIRYLEAELLDLSKSKLDISDHISAGVSNLYKVQRLFQEGSISERRRVIGAFFPEKLVFDGFDFRTNRVDGIVKLILILVRVSTEMMKEKMRKSNPLNPVLVRD